MNGYEYMFSDMDYEALMAIVGVLLIVALIAFVFAVVSYILSAAGMYAIAKRRGINNAWLAWIPVASGWILGSISDQYQYVVMNRVKKRRNTLLGLSIATLILSLPIGIISGVTAAMGVSDSLAMLSGLVLVLTIFALAVLSIVSAVFYYMALYDLYRSCMKSDGTLYLILSILFSVAEPFMVFACRNKDEGMPPRRVAPQPETVDVTVVEEDEATEEDFVEI